MSELPNYLPCPKCKKPVNLSNYGYCWHCGIILPREEFLNGINPKAYERKTSLVEPNSMATTVSITVPEIYIPHGAPMHTPSLDCVYCEVSRLTAERDQALVVEAIWRSEGRRLEAKIDLISSVLRNWIDAWENGNGGQRCYAYEKAKEVMRAAETQEVKHEP